MPRRDEAFLNATNIEATSGVTYGVTRPTKHASNPLAFPAAPSANQDHHVLNAVGGSLLPGGETALAALGAKAGFTAIVPTYLTTNDGVTFTQPNLGLVTWAGSTANNVMHPTGVGDVSAGSPSPEQRYSIVAHFYHEDSGQWVALMRGWNTTPGGQLYTSPNPYGPWTLANLLCPINGGPPFPQYDPNSIVQRPDGRWLSYGQKMTDGYPQIGIPNGYYAGRRRDLFALLSDTTDPFGTWTNIGVVLAATAAARQYYSATAWRAGETICVAAWIFDGTDNVPAANTYNGTINRVHKIALYTAGADGLTLTLADDNWLPSTGNPSDWDGGEVLTNGVPLIVGDETRFYYAADNATHHQDWVAQGNRRYLGLTTWGKNRLGKITGTGTARTTLITAATAGQLTINSTGTVEVELLDASNNVIAGYARADCDTIPADTYGHTVTWNGSAATPTAYKAKFYLTAATVYFFTADELGAAPPTTGLTLDADDDWAQDGEQLTFTASSGIRSTVTATVVVSAAGPLLFAGADADRFSASLDGTTWTPTIDLDAGETAIHLSVLPEPGDTTLTAEVWFPR